MIKRKMAYPRFHEIKEHLSLRCPVYGCFKNFNSSNQLRSHVQRQHKILTEAGISVDSSGEVQIPPELFDYVLR
jgi:hypothetical protein